jgi:hypothetical protein
MNILLLAGILFFGGGALSGIYNLILKKQIEERIEFKKTLKWINNSTNFFSIVLMILGAYIGIKESIDKSKEEKYEGIFVTPSEIIIPAIANRDIPVIIRNNYPYPIFMVTLQIKVKDGNLDLSKDFLFLPLNPGIWQSKYFTSQLPGIDAGSSYQCLIKINGGNYESPSKIELSIVGYMKEPAPNFSMPNMDSLPKTIKVPDGFMPKMYKK